jgi:transcriptional regulator with XRE-family HTH domain
MDRIDIRTLRHRRGWTQQAMAHYLGVDRSTVSRLEAGQAPSGPTEKLLAALETAVSPPPRASGTPTAARDAAPRAGEDTLVAVETRLATLAERAAEERIRPSAESLADLWRFLASHPGTRAPALYLLENGNYRAMWWGDDGEQLGLQFRGNGEIQYVVFVRRDDAPGGIARSSGRDSFRGVERLLDTFDLKRLIRREG